MKLYEIEVRNLGKVVASAELVISKDAFNAIPDLVDGTTSDTMLGYDGDVGVWELVARLAAAVLEQESSK